jgi:hypothetical protein
MLLSSEIRLLQQALKPFTFIKDFVPQLPEDLVALIANYLDPVDVICFRRVSKAWRACWTTLIVNKVLMRRFFRTDYEMYFKEFETSEDHSSVLLKKVKHSHPNYRKRFQPAILLDYLQDDASVIDVSYHSGRIALKYVHSVAIQNLYTGNITRFYSPQRVPIGWCHLSAKYLVIATVLNEVHAFSLESGTTSSVRLPSSAIYMTIEGDRIGIICSSGDTMLWTIGGALKAIPAPNPLVESKDFKVHAMILHPIYLNTLVLISKSTSSRTAGTGLSEASDDEHGNPRYSHYHFGAHTYTDFILSTSTFFPLNPTKESQKFEDYFPPTQSLQFNTYPADSQGSYTIAWFTNDVETCQVFYNIWSNTYSQEIYSVPYHTWLTDSGPRVWNSCLLYYDFSKRVLQALGPAPNDSETMDSRPIRYTLEGKSSDSSDGCGPFLMVGDDDFVVSFMDDDCCIWCFKDGAEWVSEIDETTGKKKSFLKLNMEDSKE